ncbi:MAG TPA: PAS domain-containing protein, partial [Flavitalea sp.]|nr:PAS domain-containing protein [Flavitalea sp.]
PQFSAREALEIVRQRTSQIPFIMVTGTVSEEFAADIIKSGADDYILKDRMNRLPAAIGNAIKQQEIKKENQDALEETRRSNERFQTLSKATKDAVWDWDLLTGEVWWNENFFNLLGYRQGLPIPKFYDWIRRIHPLDREKVMSRLKKIRKNTVYVPENEFRFLLPDETYVTLQDRTYVLRDDSGKSVRVIGVLVDITEQKRISQEMEVLSMIAKETSNCVMIFDRKTGYTSWVNEGFTRHTGFAKQDIYGMNPWLILGGPETDKVILNYVRTQVGKNLPFSCDILIYTKKRETKWQFMSGQPILDDNGNGTKYFVIANDISERRRMEEERIANKIELQKEVTRIILQTQEMERNVLGRELHDNINQILASVSLRLGYFIDEPENSIDTIENCREDLDRAIQEARKLSHQMVMPSFSQSSLKEELELLIENYSYKKVVKLQLAHINEKQIPSTIKETLFRIAQEQLSNIAKHAKAGRIAMRLSNDSGLVTMVINDNGIGFNMQQKRKGIGITNIFNRVGPYNGTADIISRPGKGCTLSVTIPLPVEEVFSTLAQPV